MLFESQVCLQCDYSRQGLPPDQPCPECGAIPDRRAAVIRGTANPGSALLGLVTSTVVLLLIGIFLIRAQSLPGCCATVGIVIFGAVLIHSMIRLRAGRRGELEWRVHPEGLTIRGPLRSSAWTWDQISRVEVHPRRHSRFAWIRVIPRFFVVATTYPSIYVRKDQVDMLRVEEAMGRWAKVVRRWW